MSSGCMICGGELGYEPQMCCSGRDCGCMGMPVDPPICSDECWARFAQINEMKGIIHGYSWIKVKRYVEPKEVSDPTAIVDWKYAYQSLNDHHTKETEFLIAKCRELAKIILDGEFKKKREGSE